MGYYVYITRRDRGYDISGIGIPLPKWMSYVESDEEMLAYNSVDEATRAKAGPGCTDGLAAWIAYHPYLETSEAVWFDWFDGEIGVKNPDAEIIRKMAQIATRLDARVIGESDEQYGQDGETLPNKLPSVGNRRWWHFWK